MNKIQIDKTRPFAELNIEMIEYSKANLYSNQILKLIESMKV